jgi:hypothetical protein
VAATAAATAATAAVRIIQNIESLSGFHLFLLILRNFFHFRCNVFKSFAFIRQKPAFALTIKL